MKKCVKCEVEKDEVEFYRATKSSDKLQSWCKQCKKEFNRDTGCMLLPTTKVRARKQGVPFDLAVDTLPPIPELCPILGIPLRRTLGFADDWSPSLDRLVPEKGYVTGNVAWVSYRANRIKNDSTYDELKKITAWVGKQLRKTRSL